MREIYFSKNISVIVLENKKNTIRNPQILGISWETTANREQGRWPESKECSERNIYVKAYSNRHWSHKRACRCPSGWIALMAPILHCPCIHALCHETLQFLSPELLWGRMTMCQFWAYALEALCVFHICICCPGNAMNVQTGLLGYKKHGIRQNHPSHPSQHPRMSVNLWDLGIVCYTALSQQYITDTESQQCSFITHYYYLEWTIGSSGIWL